MTTDDKENKNVEQITDDKTTQEDINAATLTENKEHEFSPGEQAIIDKMTNIFTQKVDEITTKYDNKVDELTKKVSEKDAEIAKLRKVNSEILMNTDLRGNKKDDINFNDVDFNDVIDKVPDTVKKDIQDISTDYRIYYTEYKPVIYCKVVGDYVEYTLRYLVDPRKSRYVHSSIWKHILIAHQKGELELYNKNTEYKKEEVLQEENPKKDNNVLLEESK
mgnify:CR=1 FL=1